MIEAAQHVRLSSEQGDALSEMIDWWDNLYGPQVFVVAGYAGVGKSTLVYYFINEIGISLKNVRFVCYTGKASLVLRQKQCPGQTIHSLIYEPIIKYYKCPYTRQTKSKVTGFQLRPELNPDIDLLVLDEASMISKDILKDLLSYGIRVLVLGDPGQLPPVYGDQSGLLKKPDVFLHKIHRQAADNPIIRLSMMAREGEAIPYGDYGEVKVIPRHKITPSILLGADQMLVGLNHSREMFNKHYRRLHKRTTTLPVAGDKLICLKNDWEEMVNGLPLVNGMTGTAINTCEVVDQLKRLTLLDFMPDHGTDLDSFLALETSLDLFDPMPGTEPDTDGQYEYFDYGYAITVHKSQGSEWENVVFLHEPFGSKKTHRQLLYTGITRAKKSLVLALA